MDEWRSNRPLSGEVSCWGRGLGVPVGVGVASESAIWLSPRSGTWIWEEVGEEEEFKVGRNSESPDNTCFWFPPGAGRFDENCCWAPPVL